MKVRKVLSVLLAMAMLFCLFPCGNTIAATTTIITITQPAITTNAWHWNWHWHWRWFTTTTTIQSVTTTSVRPTTTTSIQPVTTTSIKPTTTTIRPVTTTTSILSVTTTTAAITTTTTMSSQSKKVILGISFDDGLISTYKVAFPILKVRGIKATMYLVTGRVGDPENVNWEQTAELHVSGWGIENHTVSHRKDLLQLSYTEEVAEVEGANEAIIQHGLPKPKAIAPPFGNYDDQLIGIAKDLGLTSSRQAWPEDITYNVPGTFNQWALAVLSIHQSTPIQVVIDYINQAQLENGDVIFTVLIVHGVAGIPNPADDYEISTEKFTQVTDYIADLRDQGQLEVVTISEGVDRMLAEQ